MFIKSSTISLEHIHRKIEELKIKTKVKLVHINSHEP